jgi:ATP-dependent protease HslVU (ClpYQ) peptidase subunit
VTVAVAVRRPWGVALASDSLITSGDVMNLERGRKLFRLGSIGIAGAGTWRTIQQAQENLSDSLGLWKLVGLLREMRGSEWLLSDGETIVCVSGGSYTTAQDYAAIGSGTDVALGALHATRSPTAAIRAACHHVASCGGEVQRLRVRATATHFA